jgi:phage tail sheath protein FI
MKTIRCAIYTRKSSEEGLDQDFNSLDAQREACSAYISSQKQEGWVLLDRCYDDGGLSGGTMNRPALQRLLQDVDEGLIDQIVVYKIDRLTRSLTDFAKLVDRLANAIGDQTAQSGLFALEAAEGYLGIKPKILATPGYTHFRVGGAKNPVLNDQGLIAKRMGAVHISGTPATTEEAAVEFRGDVDDPRLILFDQMVKTKDGLMTPEGHVAAVGIQTDKEVGYHASWGNKVLNVLGVNRAVPYHMTDSDSRANYLMSNQVNCIINHQGGWRSWGDYAATTDTSLRFYCQLRVDDIVNEALARTIWRVVSDPLVADKVTAVLDRMNQFFGAMVEDGKLIGGEAFFYGDRNSIGALELGKIVLSYDSFSPPPITLIDIEHQRQPRYLEVTVAEILAQTNFAAAA